MNYSGNGVYLRFPNQRYCSVRLRIAEVAWRNKGWSMKKLAEQLDLDHQTVMYWNQGRTHPRLPTLLQLCRLLRCKVEDLVDDI